MNYNREIKDKGIVGRDTMSGVVVFGSTIAKKCERLATAIYLVTSFLSDNEPMRGRLRALTLESVRDAILLKNGGNVLEANVLEALRANVLETLSLLELSLVAGLVSEMNFTILKREYVALRDSIDIKKASRESRTDSLLGNDFFGSPESNQPSSQSTTAVFYKGHSIGHNTVPMSDRNAKGHDTSLSQSSSLRGGTTKQSSTLSSSPRATTDIAKESRRTRILKLIKDNREVTIKDIVNHFPDLSEKTIQRELVLFVENNVLKKSGERRWSKYSLK